MNQMWIILLNSPWDWRLEHNLDRKLQSRKSHDRNENIKVSTLIYAKDWITQQCMQYSIYNMQFYSKFTLYMFTFPIKNVKQVVYGNDELYDLFSRFLITLSFSIIILVSSSSFCSSLPFSSFLRLLWA